MCPYLDQGGQIMPAILLRAPPHLFGRCGISVFRSDKLKPFQFKLEKLIAYPDLETSVGIFPGTFPFSSPETFGLLKSQDKGPRDLQGH